MEKIFLCNRYRRKGRRKKTLAFARMWKHVLLISSPMLIFYQKSHFISHSGWCTFAEKNIRFKLTQNWKTIFPFNTEPSVRNIYSTRCEYTWLFTLALTLERNQEEEKNGEEKRKSVENDATLLNWSNIRSVITVIEMKSTNLSA